MNKRRKKPTLVTYIYIYNYIYIYLYIYGNLYMETNHIDPYGNWKPDSFFPSQLSIPVVACNSWLWIFAKSSALNSAPWRAEHGDRSLRWPWEPTGMGQNSIHPVPLVNTKIFWYCKWILYINPPKYRQAKKIHPHMAKQKQQLTRRNRRYLAT